MHIHTHVCITLKTDEGDPGQPSRDGHTHSAVQNKQRGHVLDHVNKQRCKQAKSYSYTFRSKGTVNPIQTKEFLFLKKMLNS